MPRWLLRILTRIRKLAAGRNVAFTLKARQELANLGAGLDEGDACDALTHLSAGDFVGRRKSESTGEWLYVFKPEMSAMTVYIKLILRSDCIVVSFHQDEDRADEEQD